MILRKTNGWVVVLLVLLSVIVPFQWYRNWKLGEDVENLKRELEAVTHNRVTAHQSAPQSHLDDVFDHSLDFAESFDSMREMMDQFFQGSISSFGTDFDSSIFDDFSSSILDIRVEEMDDSYQIIVSPFDPETHQVDLDLVDQTLTLKFTMKSSQEDRIRNEFGQSGHVARSEQVVTRLITLEDVSSDSTLETEIDEKTLRIMVSK